MDLSIVIPVYNEEQNVKQMYLSTVNVLSNLSEYFEHMNVYQLSRKYRTYELIFVDDGSTDASYVILQRLYRRGKNVRVIKFRKNFGQTAAMSAGFAQAKGNVIVTLDADLQNDPRDIPRLLVKMEEGYDVVSGWRKQRHDSVSKVLFSRLASILRRRFIGGRIHDYGCTLKAYRRECFDEVSFYGEMHRYIPAILRWRGYKLGEIKVRHHRRRFGVSNYDTSRLVKGFLDMLNVWFWSKYSARPLHIFGGLGILSGFFGSICLFYALYLRIFKGSDLSDTFLPTIGVFAILLGVQFFVSGLLADIMIKNYFKGRKDYSIERILK